MSQASRQGSILLLCISIVTALAVIAYAFVRMVQLQQETSGSVNAQLLAREAAVMGLHHAMEQIQRDYNDEPFTRLDGPARAPFVSHVNPYYSWHGTDSSSSQIIDIDDASEERSVYAPIFQRWGQMRYNGVAPFYSQSNAEGLYPTGIGGMITYDGRGRYYEPGFFNRAKAGGVFTPGVPSTTPVRFGEGIDTPTSIAVPERHDGLWLDERWRRIDAADSREKRAKARYRLRYVVGVTDLDGALLMTGDPVIDRQNTAGSPRIIEAKPATPGDNTDIGRVLRHQHAAAAVVAALDSTFSDDTGSQTAGVRAKHIFIGRGSTANFDRDPSASPAAPLAFPLMYRRPETAGQGVYYQWFAQGPFGGWPPNLPVLARDPYTPAGMILPPSNRDDYPMRRSLLGPQVSFKNFDLAMAGSRLGDENNDGAFPSTGSLTPFGRGLRKETTGSFASEADTPWRVNIMTAPVQVIQAMIAGYMPRGGMLVCYRPSQIGRDAGLKTYFAPLEGSCDLFVRELFPAFNRYLAPARTSPAISPDYHLASDCSNDPGYRTAQARYPGILAFNGYFAPVTRDTVSGAVAAAQNLPNTAPNVLWSDMLGRYLRRLPDGSSADRGISHGDELPDKAAADPYNAGFIWRHSGTNEWSRARRGTHQPAFITDGSIPRYTDAMYGPHYYSIWDTIGNAMANAVAVAREANRQYPTTVTSQPTWGGFNGSPAPTVQSIRDIDALFLANFGTNINDPTNVTPIPAWYGDNWNGYRTFIPTYNIASLRTAVDAITTVRLLGLNDPAFNPSSLAWSATHPMYATLNGLGLDPSNPALAAMRSQAMEMIINDFRLSFFGSGPGYDDFRLLDLNGDGKINSSVFATAGSPAEVGCGVDQYVMGTTAAVPAGQHFSVTGSFFMGKSRFWRVMVRGEVWDNLLDRSISEETLDSVLVVDPVDAANELDPSASNRQPDVGQYSTHVIYQRWFFNLYRAHQSRSH